jgi:hypothetical protein
MQMVPHPIWTSSLSIEFWYSPLWLELRAKLSIVHGITVPSKWYLITNPLGTVSKYLTSDLQFSGRHLGKSIVLRDPLHKFKTRHLFE